MKCNLPKSWDQLPQKEKDAISKMMTDFAYDIIDKEEANVQEIWIKLNCINMRNCGATEEDLLQYIAGWKRIYAKNARMKTKEEQAAWIEEEMKKCFPTCGFPQIRIDELKKKGERR